MVAKHLDVKYIYEYPKRPWNLPNGSFIGHVFASLSGYKADNIIVNHKAAKLALNLTFEKIKELAQLRK